MADFDIILLGESYFTDVIRREFDGRLKILLVSNSCMDREFSTDFFPDTCFIPQKTGRTNVFGQIASDGFRMDITPDQEIFSLLFVEELRESQQFLKDLYFSSSTQLDFANRLVVENFGNSMFNGISANFKEIFRNLKNFVRLIRPEDGDSGENFSCFMNGLAQFFAPGEVNPAFYHKYLIYSLLTKTPGVINFLRTAPGQNIAYIDSQPLKAISSAGGWSLQFPKMTVTGRMLISAVPPHLLSMCGIKHGFTADYDRCFYRIRLREDAAPPAGMAENLVFINNKTVCFIKEDENGLNFFIPSGINTPPSADTIIPVIKNILPHLTRFEFDSTPHIFPFYVSKSKRGFNTGKNVFFFKNAEYPAFGVDGEMIYEGKIKEIIWKNFS